MTLSDKAPGRTAKPLFNSVRFQQRGSPHSCVPIMCQLTQTGLYSTERSLRDYEEVLRNPHRYECTQTSENMHFKTTNQGVVRVVPGAHLFNKLRATPRRLFCFAHTFSHTLIYKTI